MKGIKIGVIVEKKHRDGNQEPSNNSNQEPSNGETQAFRATKGVYVNDPVSHKNFVNNIFSVLAT